jgi:biotin transport system substrate-specific component
VGYVLAGALGLAVFTPSATLPPGFLRLLGPTGGYLLAYPLAAFATGWLSERGWDRRYVTSLSAMLVGLGVIYAGGVSWLAVAILHSLSGALTTGLVPFVILDLLKVTAAALILPQAWRLAGRRLD